MFTHNYTLIRHAKKSLTVVHSLQYDLQHPKLWIVLQLRILKERNSVNHDIPCPATTYLHLKTIHKGQKK